MKVKELINEAEEDVINFSITFEIITPESAEHGDAEERGFLDENATADYEEMVEMMQGMAPSNSPPSIENAHNTWYTAYDVDVDYKTGAHENNSYHGKTDKDSELMFKAWQEANAARR
jgi:hypothetical protein